MEFVSRVISLEDLLKRWGCPEAYLVSLYEEHVNIYMQYDNKYQNFLNKAWYDYACDSYVYYNEEVGGNDFIPGAAIRFDMDEVERYEFSHPGLGKNEDGRHTGDSVSGKIRIGEYEAQLNAALQQVEELKQALAEAREQQAAAPQEVVTVNTVLWEASCGAACVVTEQIAKNRERGITKGAFLDRMRAAATGKKTCSGADRAAWKALPDEYKNGPGCPKK